MQDDTKNSPAQNGNLRDQHQLLLSHVPISFWGGIDPATANVIDEHHPLTGNNIAGKVLALPGSRGSCSGSSVLLELIDQDLAPAALLFTEAEEILVLGALIGRLMFNKQLPLYRVSEETFATLQGCKQVSVKDGLLIAESDLSHYQLDLHPIEFITDENAGNGFQLNDNDERILAGEHGKAAQFSLQVILNMARLQDSWQLLDIAQSHIDSCVYNGLSSYKFAKQLADWGAKVAVPTTLNALSVDQRQWRDQGIAVEFGEPASSVGDAYVQMGAKKTFTCAPYLLDSAPKASENIGWAESNAVAYANSVLGARTQKYPDFLDICIAITGRAPAGGTHLDSGRTPDIVIDVEPPKATDDSFWPLLGYHIGLLAENSIPYVRGLSQSAPSTDDLKAFSAAFATTSSVPMFHIDGITPESSSILNAMQNIALNELPAKTVRANDLLESWRSLNTATSEDVDMICLGNPHFSLTECASFAAFCAGRDKAEYTDVIITLGRDIFSQAEANGIVETLQAFGVTFVMDTCWCMIQAPIIPKEGSTLMTNSGKYAHYGPGLVNRPIHFASLKECADSACSGHRVVKEPEWLS